MEEKEISNKNYEVINDEESLKKVLLPNSYLCFEMMESNYHKAKLSVIGLKNEKGIFMINPKLLEKSVDLRLFLTDENDKNMHDN